MALFEHDTPQYLHQYGLCFSNRTKITGRAFTHGSMNLGHPRVKIISLFRAWLITDGEMLNMLSLLTMTAAEGIE